jgi:tetratricopeptide (TPR) repeat protein
MNLQNQAERPAIELGFYQVARGIRIRQLEVEGAPDKAVAVLWRALFWAGEQDVPLPIPDIQPALRLQSDLSARFSRNVDIWREVIHLFRNAKVLNKEGKKQEALEALERSAALFPPHAELLFDLGRAHAQMRNFQKAVESFDRALLLQPGDIYCLHDKARSLMPLGNYAEALEILVEANLRQPEKPGLAQDLAKVQTLTERAAARQGTA